MPNKDSLLRCMIQWYTGLIGCAGRLYIWYKLFSNRDCVLFDVMLVAVVIFGSSDNGSFDVYFPLYFSSAFGRDFSTLWCCIGGPPESRKNYTSHSRQLLYLVTVLGEVAVNIQYAGTTHRCDTPDGENSLQDSDGALQYYFLSCASTIWTNIYDIMLAFIFNSPCLCLFNLAFQSLCRVLMIPTCSQHHFERWRHTLVL